MNRQAYPSDLTDREWAILAPHMPLPKTGGRPAKYSTREILNAIFSVLITGCQWRMLPHDLPTWQTAYHYFRVWRIDGTWDTVLTTLRRRLRENEGRDPQPTAAIIDSQSVKTTSVGGDERGYDAGKKITGRKRHILVDTTGVLLLVWVHAADLQDRDGAKVVFEKAQPRFPQLQKVWADGGYGGKLVTWVKETCGWTMDVVKRPDKVKGFVVLPRRWVVERTFAWFSQCRRLSKDYEYLAESSEAMVMIAMIRLLTLRLAGL